MILEPGTITKWHQDFSHIVTFYFYSNSEKNVLIYGYHPNAKQFYWLYQSWNLNQSSNEYVLVQ